MIPLGMVMLDVFAQRPPQGALTKENDLRQTLILYRLDPAFSIRIQVRTAGLNTFHSSSKSVDIAQRPY